MLDEGREDSRTRDRWGPSARTPRSGCSHLAAGCRVRCRRCVSPALRWLPGNRHVTVAVSRDPTWIGPVTWGVVRHQGLEPRTH
jgi:hypothetical protein